MIFNHPSLFLDWLQSPLDDPGIPFVKVTLDLSCVAIVPESTEEFLDRPDSGHLQVGLFEFTKLLGEGFIEILFVNKPGILGACQTSISSFLECFVLLATHFIDGLIKVLVNVKPIMHVVTELAEAMPARGNFFSTEFLYAFHMSRATPVTCCCCFVVNDCSINALQASSVRSSTTSSSLPCAESQGPCCKSTRLLMVLWPLRNCFSSMPR